MILLPIIEIAFQNKVLDSIFHRSTRILNPLGMLREFFTTLWVIYLWVLIMCISLPPTEIAEAEGRESFKISQNLSFFSQLRMQNLNVTSLLRWLSPSRLTTIRINLLSQSLLMACRGACMFIFVFLDRAFIQ